MIDNDEKDSFLLIMNKITINKIKPISAENMKGILFEYYVAIRNKIAYKNIKHQSREYLQKINMGISEE